MFKSKRMWPRQPLSFYAGPSRRLLGSGSYGKVYTSREYPQYAIKERLEDDPQSLMVEVSLLMNLDHPNLVRIIDVELTYHYFVMACHDTDLFQLLEEKTIPLDQEAVSRQMISVVYYINTQHIWHRDIKLDNFLYNYTTKQITLIDFGLADNRSYLDPDFVYSTSYTMYYRSPELLMGSRKYHVEADVWALGLCICYLFLDKEQLFDHDRLDNQIKLLQEIYFRLGNPVQVWPACQELVRYTKMNPQRTPRLLDQLLQDIPTFWRTLIVQMVAYPPQRASIQAIYDTVFPSAWLPPEPRRDFSPLSQTAVRWSLVELHHRAYYLRHIYNIYTDISQSITTYFLAAYLFDRYFLQDKSHDATEWHQIAEFCLLTAARIRNDDMKAFRTITVSFHDVLPEQLDVTLYLDYFLADVRDMDEMDRSAGAYFGFLLSLTRLTVEFSFERLGQLLSQVIRRQAKNSWSTDVSIALEALQEIVGRDEWIDFYDEYLV